MRLAPQLVILTMLVSAAVAADGYEPDNSFANATTLYPNGTAQNHTFDGASDYDYVSFGLEQGVVYELSTQNWSDGATTDTYAEVFWPDQTTWLVINDDDLRQNGTNSRAVFVAPQNGTYFARISEYNFLGGGNYSVSLQRLGEVQLNTTPNESFSVVQNQTFTVQTTVTCTGGPCGEVTLSLDPQQNPISRPTKTADGSIVDPAVRSTIAQQGSAPVIITLLEPGRRPQSNKDARIAQAQTALLAAVPGTDFSARYAYQRIPAIAGTLTAAGLARISANPHVAAITLDRTVSVALSSSVPSINGSAAWNTTVSSGNLTGTGVTVCVIDTGVNYTHPDFGSCPQTGDINDGTCSAIIGGVNFCPDNNCNTTSNDPMDRFIGHGTHVAGIVASRDATYRGVAPNASIVAVNVFPSTGLASVSTVIAGIDWCIANATRFNISVITMSLGANTHAENCNRFPESAAIDAARDAGIIVTVAAGNDFDTFDALGLASPACAANATSVGSTNDAGVPSSFSQRDVALDIWAPGESVTATDAFSSSHVQYSGTSMATPHVAGLAAILVQQARAVWARNETPASIEHRLKSGGMLMTDAAYSRLVQPRLSVSGSLSQKGDIPTTPGALPFWTPDTNPTSCTLAEGESCSLNWTVNTTASNGTYSFFVIAQTTYRYTESDHFAVAITVPPTNVSVTLALNDSTPHVGDMVLASVTALSNDSQNRSNLTLTLNAPSLLLLPLNATPDWTTNASGMVAWTLNVTADMNSSVALLLNATANGSEMLSAVLRDQENTLLAQADFSVVVPAPDVSAPVVSAFAATGVSQTGATLTLSTDENATCRYHNADALFGNLPFVFDTTGTTAHSAVLSGLDSGTEYTFFARCADTYGNQNNASASVSFSTSSAASSHKSGGGGGGGGGSGGAVSAAASTSGESQTFRVLPSSASAPVVLTVTKKDVPVDSISFSAADVAGAVSVSVAAVQAPVHAKTGAVFGYVRVDHPAEFAPDAATLTFTVPLSWLSSVSGLPSAVRLFRSEGDSWRELPTTFLRADAAEAVFSADSPGLSLFAIGLTDAVAQEPAAVEAPADAANGSVDENTTREAGIAVSEHASSVDPVPPPAEASGRAGWWLALVVVLGGAGLGAWILGKRKRRF